MKVAEREKQKYSQIWAAENYTSGTALTFSELVLTKIGAKTIAPLPTLLEIGCGNGTTMKQLMPKSIVYGTDITIQAAIDNGIPRYYLIESPVWELSNISVQYTVSTDVLEHIPLSKIAKSIKAIIGATEKETIHAISTRPAVRKYQGHNVHLTVRPISWWRSQFEKHNQKNIKITLIDTNEL